jgi:NADP-dependent alcohol dehydrogenase
MNNFEYYNPVKVVFGRDTISQLSNLIEPGRKVLMIYGGGSIKRNGVYDQVKAALSDFDMDEFGGIEANPKYETCLKAIEKVKSFGADFLLAVGGGSVIDATKLIAAAALYQGDDPWEIMLSEGAVVDKALGFGVVLTLPATGSEMNANSVISRLETKEKLFFGSAHVYPAFSVLDPQTTFSLPTKQVRNGIVDTFVHVMEQYATFDVTSRLQDRQAESIVAVLTETAQDIIKDEKNYDLRADFMWVATQALNGLIGCGVAQDWSTHKIGHELTAFYGIDHAESLAIVLPALWKYKKADKCTKLAQLARRVWSADTDDDQAAADIAIRRTVEFFKSVNMPTTLRDFNIPRECVDKIVKRFTDRNIVLGEKQDIMPADVGRILELAY